MSTKNASSASSFSPTPTSRHIRRGVSHEGYIVDDVILRRIDTLAHHITDTAAESPTPLEVEYQCDLRESETIHFGSVDELLAYTAERFTSILNIRSTHEREDVAGISINYNPAGVITISAYGSASDFEFGVDRVADELSRTSAEFPWWVRRLLLPALPARLFRAILLSSSLGLLVLSGFYVYGLKFGINIDESIAASVPYGLKYRAAVAEALQSTDIQRKLDVLLYGQLQDFTTLDRWLVRTQQQLAFLLLAVLVSGLVLLLARKLKGLYPQAFFAIGRNAQLLTTMQRRRDFWEGAVLVAFAVNLVAGLLLAFFT